MVLPQVFKDSIKPSTKQQTDTNGSRETTEWTAFLKFKFPTAKLTRSQQGNSQLITQRTTVNKNELTGEVNPTVRLVDFRNWDRNNFIISISFVLLTLVTKSFRSIILTLFYSLTVCLWWWWKPKIFEDRWAFERSLFTSNPIRQHRTITVKKEKKAISLQYIQHHYPRPEARVGTIMCSVWFFYNNWVDIFPRKYIKPLHSHPMKRQEVLIHGMLNKEILVDILEHFTLFIEIKKRNRGKN